MTRPKMLNKFVLAALGIALLGATVAVVTGGSSQAAAPLATSAAQADDLPPAVVVPAGNAAIAELSAQGVQVYQCTAGAWVFLEPAASLSGKTTGKNRTYQTAVHFRGPSWESTLDGSLVTATAVGSAPVPGSISLLLLKAATNRGDGIFGKVTYIQRLNTAGGLAPAGGCTDGKTIGVPYTAKYRFYAAA